MVGSMYPVVDKVTYQVYCSIIANCTDSGSDSDSGYGGYGGYSFDGD